MKKAIIFDLDGTLLYTIPTIQRAMNLALTGVALKTITENQTREALGHGVSHLVKTVLGDTHMHLYEDVLLEYQKQYANDLFQGTHVYEGIIPLLQSLKNEGFLIGVASNKGQPLVERLCTYFFNHLIDAIRGDMPPRPKKPNPEMVLEVMDMLHVRNEEVIYIGDSIPDIEVAKNISVTHIAVGYGFRSPEILLNYNPDYFVYTVEALQKTLKKVLYGSH